MDSSAHRRVGRRSYLVLLGTTVVAMSSALGTIACGADASSGSVLEAARTAIAQQIGVHVVFRAHSGSTGLTEKIIADVGGTGGTERILEGTANVAIRVTPTFAYVSGNPSGLTKLFGMTSGDAKELGTKWEAWKVGTSQYATLKSDLTMKSVSALLPNAKGTKVSTEIRQGEALHVLTWTTPARASVPKLSNTLVISAKAPTLPVTKSATAPGGTKITTTLSAWGENVVGHAPPSDRTVSSSSIGG
jgi:hypothetical protein